MNAYLVLATVGVMGLAGCDKGEVHASTQTTSATQPAPDNTKVNARDKSPTYTPLDQGNDKADLLMTQRIRQAVVADPALSLDAKNVKIITTNRFVILRGPVKSATERDKIHAAALAVVDGSKLDDELEIEAH
jgi:hyperosmotically inducible periplasmic protein